MSALGTVREREDFTIYRDNNGVVINDLDMARRLDEQSLRMTLCRGNRWSGHGDHGHGGDDVEFLHWFSLV